MRRQLIQNMKDAIIHHKKALLKYKGISPWQKVVKELRHRDVLSDMVYKKNIVCRFMTVWNQKYQKIQEAKELKAIAFYRSKAIIQSIKSWQKGIKSKCNLLQIAVDFETRRISQRQLICLKKKSLESYSKRQAKEAILNQRADLFAKKYVSFKSIAALRQ